MREHIATLTLFQIFCQYPATIGGTISSSECVERDWVVPMGKRGQIMMILTPSADFMPQRA